MAVPRATSEFVARRSRSWCTSCHSQLPGPPSQPPGCAGALSFWGCHDLPALQWSGSLDPPQCATSGATSCRSAALPILGFWTTTGTSAAWSDRCHTAALVSQDPQCCLPLGAASSPPTDLLPNQPRAGHGIQCYGPVGLKRAVQAGHVGTPVAIIGLTNTGSHSLKTSSSVVQRLLDQALQC